MERLLLIDGMALLFRGYFATSFTGKIRTTAAGIPTNAVHFFVRYLQRVIENENPTHIICCWDTPEPTFRHQSYEHYKANRPEPPEALIPQFDLAVEIVAGLGIKNAHLPGFEADDLIGTLASQYKEHMPVHILTSDQDSLQLIDHNVHILIMKKGFGNYSRCDKEMLLEMKGLRPEQIIDLKALMGDQSDNYPGVPGIGEKTALKLLLEYDNIETLLTEKNNLSPAVKNKLEKGIELLNLSYRLATISTDAPVEIDGGLTKWEVDEQTIHKVFNTYELQGLIPGFKPWFVTV